MILIPVMFWYQAILYQCTGVVYGYSSEEKDKEYQTNVTMSNAEKLLEV